MDYYIYIIETERGLYTGIAKDIAKRFSKHVSGKGAKFTRAFPPTDIRLCLKVEGRSDALKIESAIKKLSRLEKLKLISGDMTESVFSGISASEIVRCRVRLTDEGVTFGN